MVRLQERKSRLGYSMLLTRKKPSFTSSNASYEGLPEINKSEAKIVKELDD